MKKIIEINSIYHSNDKIPETATNNRYYTMEYDEDGIGENIILNFETGKKALEYAKSRIDYDIYFRFFNEKNGRIKYE